MLENACGGQRIIIWGQFSLMFLLVCLFSETGFLCVTTFAVLELTL